MRGNFIVPFNKKIDRFLCVVFVQMTYLTKEDYAELKRFSNDDLNAYLKVCESNRSKAFVLSQTLTGEEYFNALEAIKEYDAWILAYNTEITIRLAIKTPPNPYCHGCNEGHLNQMGHYGGCIQDPNDSDYV